MMDRKKIYMACPYSDESAGVRAWRFELVNRAAAKLMQEGHLVFSPISHTHPIAEAGDLPKGWEFWEAYDRTFLEWADEVHVLMIDGWRESKGVTAEIRIARELKKRVVYVCPVSDAQICFDDVLREMFRRLRSEGIKVRRLSIGEMDPVKEEF